MYTVYGRTWYGEHVYHYHLSFEQATAEVDAMEKCHNYYEISMYKEQ